ncbi:glycosyl hydrolase family 95 catalytic domain-containing protein [Streptomyces cavernicola]|uniref:Glycoside hydrolase N-terminal domain-containing protein n=1 Tax=Streptomyces cavernicola TaxID=3043613 RepID=A0ABT6SGS8_9ACTN|nr:glycoside hydrolase N-terminal domain-containing protein [Streptomyces sp. B-S-A6]MDI3406481.1 glycoside hydrolase N-terminal domain-containing protein [Streptomyces sp. B-S-A6]
MNDARTPGPDRRTFLKLGGLVAAAPVIATYVGGAEAAAAQPPGDVATSAAAAGAAAAAGDLRVAMAGAADSDRILMEGLPVGNGRLAALVGGGAREHLALNEGSLWSGGQNPSGDYGSMGSYKSLGHVYIDLGHDPAQIEGYRRELDLETGVVTVRYTYQNREYVRETFASHPDQVVITTVTTSASHALSGTVRVVDGGGRTTGATAARPGRLSVAGAIGGGGVRYGWQALVDAPGARTIAAEQATASTSFAGATSLTVVVGARTDYLPDAAKGFRSSADPLAEAARDTTRALARGVPSLHDRQLDDFRALFTRQTLTIDGSSDAQLASPTFQRVENNQTTPDPQLYALYYQFARYLVLSTSRPGGLPLNLQGLWNVSDSPPWSSDYHHDINIQMCYWLSDPGNLPGTIDPLVDYLHVQIPAWRQATRAVVHKPGTTEPVRGWTVRVSSNVSGGLGWDWLPAGCAWLAWHLWDHYTYTLDETFLRERAYPVLKEVCQYLEDLLVDDGAGKLVVPETWTPEQTIAAPWRVTRVGFEAGAEMRPYEDGVSMDQELAWDAFGNFVEASRILGLDADYRATVAGLRERLHVPEIGSWGQLQEWYPDRDSPDNHHRHVSHLWGLFPGRQLTPDVSPALAEAARVSLAARGIGPTGWSAAWNANLWATLGDPDKTMQALRNLTQPVTSDHGEVDMNYHGGVYPNLFDAHPPFQIDGNIGGARAFVQAIAASSSDRIDLLKALPAQWPTGAFTGIRARGGFELDVSWADGALTEVTVRSLAGRETTLRYRDLSARVSMPKGGEARYDGTLRRIES